MKQRHQQKLVLLSALLFVGWNAPILLLFDGSTAFFGIPKIYLFIFSFWLFSVIISYVIINRYNE